MGDYCFYFEARKPLPRYHPDEGVCSGCKWGKGIFPGDECPREKIKKKQLVAEQKIEEKPFVVASIPAYMPEEDGGLVLTKVDVTVELPHEAVFRREVDEWDNVDWFLVGWKPLRQPTEEEKRQAIEETIAWIKKVGGTAYPEP